ncbi:uncharacterized protein VP01_262g3, partial [Puccinia sorghi]
HATISGIELLLPTPFRIVVKHPLFSILYNNKSKQALTLLVSDFVPRGRTSNTVNQSQSADAQGDTLIPDAKPSTHSSPSREIGRNAWTSVSTGSEQQQREQDTSVAGLSKAMHRVLDQHQENFRGYQEAYQGGDQEMNSLYMTQDLATHHTLVKNLGLRLVLVLTEGWNPVDIRRAQRQSQAALEAPSSNQPELSRSQQTQWTEKNVQEGLQKLSLRGDVPHGAPDPEHLPIHRWSKKDPTGETEQPRIENYVTKEFFVSTLNNLFHRLDLLKENPPTSSAPFILAKSEQPDTSLTNLIDVDKEVRKQIIIVSRLNLLFKNSASEWYKGLKNSFGLQTWDWWKKQIDLKFGNATWRRRVQKAFYTSRFDASATPVAAWVTKQYKRIKSIEPYLNIEQINIKLLDLCDGEVAYAVKCALDTTHADISTLINVLQEIVDQTNLGKKPKNRFVPSNTSPSEKPKIYSDKPKSYADIKCNNCGLKGHIAKDCRRKKSVNNLVEQPDSDPADILEDEDSELEDNQEEDVVGNVFHIDEVKGKSSVMKMKLGNNDVNALLDSGAYISCVGVRYLLQIDKNYKDRLIAPDNKIYKSCNQKLNYIGKISYDLQLEDVTMPMVFMVMNDIKAKYFIIGNNYLHAYKINMINDTVRYVTYRISTRVQGSNKR